MMKKYLDKKMNVQNSKLRKTVTLLTKKTENRVLMKVIKTDYA